MAFTKERALSIIKSILRQRDSEASLENFGAAELFEDKARELCTKYEIDFDSVDYAFEDVAKVINELGSALVPNIFARSNAVHPSRKYWFEELAKVVAGGYNCKVDADETAGVSFYGYDLDRELAIFMFLKLAEVANELRDREQKLAKSFVGKPSSFDFKLRKKVEHPAEWMGNDVWEESFHRGFREEIKNSFLRYQKPDEEKVKAVESFYRANRNSDVDYLPKLIADFSNEQAYEVGKICGYNTAHKATKAPSALTVKKSKLVGEDTVWILVDDSGSMHWGGKIEQARVGAIEYAKTAVEKGLKVGVASFGDKNRIIVPPTDKVDEDFIVAMQVLNASGAETDLTSALRLVQSKFLNRNVKRVVMVVTDGMPTSKDWGKSGEESALAAANDCKRLGIQIFAIGTDGCNQDFLDKLVSKAGYGQLVDSTRLALGMGEMAGKL